VLKLTRERSTYRRAVGNRRILFDLYPEQLLIEVRYIERRTSTTYRKR